MIITRVLPVPQEADVIIRLTAEETRTLSDDLSILERALNSLPRKKRLDDLRVALERALET